MPIHSFSDVTCPTRSDLLRRIWCPGLLLRFLDSHPLLRTFSLLACALSWFPDHKFGWIIVSIGETHCEHSHPRFCPVFSCVSVLPVFTSSRNIYSWENRMFAAYLTNMLIWIAGPVSPVSLHAEKITLT
jgi:hypothetical protein